MTQTTSVPTVNMRQPPPGGYFLWDFAGADGRQAAIALFTPAILHLAPYQSLPAIFQQQACAVLRLCENNFRVALPEKMSFEAAIVALELQVWVKSCPAANLTLPVDDGLSRLRAIATTKPIYTLNPFPCDRAVPARIKDLAILAWHHRWQGQPRLTIQTAQANVEAIQRVLAP